MVFRMGVVTPGQQSSTGLEQLLHSVSQVTESYLGAALSEMCCCCERWVVMVALSLTSG